MLSIKASSGAGGTQYSTLRLTNAGATSCTIDGYPGVSVVNTAGSVVQHPAQRIDTQGTESEGPPSQVTLAAHTSALFDLTSVNVIPNPHCPKAYVGTTLRVYPPGQTAALDMPYPQPFCDLGVGPVYPAQ